MTRISMKRLGRRYRALREELSTMERDCTQDMLADILDIKKPQISNLENGKKEPSLTELRAYSNYFNCPMEYLTGDKNNRHYENMDTCNDYGLTDRSIETLKLIKKYSDSKMGWHNYLHYLEIINILIEYGNFKDLIDTLHDYLFFDFSNASIIEDVCYIDKKNEKCTTELPISNITLTDKHRAISFPANILSEPVLDTVLISKIKSLRKEIQENKLKNAIPLLKEEENRINKD